MSSLTGDGNIHRESVRSFSAASTAVTGGRKLHGADGGSCFWCADVNRSVHCGRLTGDVQFTCLQIQIVPLQPRDLAAPHPGTEFEQEEFKAPVRFRLYDEPLHLLAGKHLHLLRLFGRQFTADSRVHPDQPLSPRLFKRGPAQGVAHSDHPIRHTRAESLGTDLPSAYFLPGIELL